MAEDSDTFKSSTLARSEYNTIAESYSEVVPALRAVAREGGLGGLKVYFCLNQ